MVGDDLAQLPFYHFRDYLGHFKLAEHYNLFLVTLKQRLSCFSQIVVWKEPQVVEFLLVLLRFVSIVLASF